MAALKCWQNQHQLFGGEDFSDFSVIKFGEARNRRKNLRKVGVGQEVLCTRSPKNL